MISKHPQSLLTLWLGSLFLEMWIGCVGISSTLDYSQNALASSLHVTNENGSESDHEDNAIEENQNRLASSSSDLKISPDPTRT